MLKFRELSCSVFDEHEGSMEVIYASQRRYTAQNAAAENIQTDRQSGDYTDV
ncbi:MAG: hypothetical protein LBN30_02360 [Oscillospiraceae bacterium]|jgi:hypothetical protein|nr:hypothetical protein [Oscillospiraceae bacterium]